MRVTYLCALIDYILQQDHKVQLENKIPQRNSEFG